MQICTSERLVMRLFNAGDAAFIHRLLNEEGWLRFIGNRSIDSLDAARRYIDEVVLARQASHGFSFYAVERKEDGVVLGMCGLVKRDTLDDVDIGYAFLVEHCGQGYAVEAARAVMDYARDVLRLPRLLAITSPDNERSIRVIEKLGMRFEARKPFGELAQDANVYACRFNAAESKVRRAAS